MRGIILAAGKGSRLNGTAGDSPKCLVKAGGMTLIERQIRALRHAGVDDIAVVVGCQAEQVRRACGQDITYVENDKYAQTNSMYSLWMARPLLFEGFVVLNCDVLFHPVLLDDLLTSRHEDALLLAYREADQPPFGDEEMKVRVQCGRVREMSKQMRRRRRRRRESGHREVRPAGSERAGRASWTGWSPPAVCATGRPGHSTSSRRCGRCTPSAPAVSPGLRSTSRRTISAPCARCCRRSICTTEDVGAPDLSGDAAGAPAVLPGRAELIAAAELR